MELHSYVGVINPGVWGVQALWLDTPSQTTQRTMIRVRCLAVTCARGVSRSSFAAKGVVARPATVCHATQRAFSDSLRNLAQQPPPQSAGSPEHDDRVPSERAVGAGGAMHGSLQQDGEVEEAGYMLQRQIRAVSYPRSSNLVLLLALYLNSCGSSALKQID